MDAAHAVDAGPTIAHCTPCALLSSRVAGTGRTERLLYSAGPSPLAWVGAVRRRQCRYLPCGAPSSCLRYARADRYNSRKRCGGGALRKRLTAGVLLRHGGLSSRGTAGFRARSGVPNPGCVAGPRRLRDPPCRGHQLPPTPRRAPCQWWCPLLPRVPNLRITRRLRPVCPLRRCRRLLRRLCVPSRRRRRRWHRALQPWLGCSSSTWHRKRRAAL